MHIPEVLLISRDRFADSRGWFTELYNEENLRKAGFDVKFVQDNLSLSAPGVLRGLHFQVGPEQGKLVSCVQGRIYDVAADIRPGSPTYGQHVAAELSADGGESLWVPPGFAHGFAVIGSEPALVLYKVDQHRSFEGERGILWSDPTLAIPWPIEAPMISERDRGLKTLAEYLST
ncbi:MAG: dTDP-4-dehydrorhamnose 3,5-epimerase [Candidatus Limnocylindrus sp.]